MNKNDYNFLINQ